MKHAGDIECIFSLEVNSLKLLPSWKFLVWVKVPDVKSPPKEARESGTKTKTNSEQCLILERRHILYQYLKYCQVCLFNFVFEYGLPILIHYCLFIHVFYILICILLG